MEEIRETSADNRKPTPEDAGATHIEQMEYVETPVETGDFKVLLQHPKILLVCLFGNVGAVMYGFDNQVLSLCLSMTSFQAQFGVPSGSGYVIPAYWQSLWGALAQLATAMGAFGIATISDRFGRRMSFSLAGMVSMTGITVLYTASLPAIFLVGKMVNAFALGMVIATSQSYIAEIAPIKTRGILLAAYILCQFIGNLIACVIAMELGRIARFDSVDCPRDPIFYVRRDNLDQARRAFERLYPKKADIDTNLAQAIQTNLEEREAANLASETTYLECLHGINWRRTRIILYCNGLNQFLGSTFYGQAPYFMTSVGMSSNKVGLLPQIGNGLSIVIILVVFCFMAQVGRRALRLIGIVICVSLYLPMGIAGCFPSNSGALWTVGILLQLASMLGTAPTTGPALATSGEVPELRLKSKSQSIGFFFNYFSSTVFNVVVPYMFSTDEGDLGGKMGFIYSALSAITFVAIYLEVPETKDMTYSEINRQFQQCIPTRKFQSAVEELRGLQSMKA